MTDQRTMLGRIAASLRRAHGGAPGGHVAPPPPSAVAAAPHDTPTLLARFTVEWQSLAGQVHAVASEREAIDVLASVCSAHAATRVLGWSDEAIGIDGFERQLSARGIAVDHGIVPRGTAARGERLEALAQLAVGVTGADALLAESGSVVLASGPGRPRLASLLPPVHVTIVRPRRVHLSLEHLLAAEPALGSASSNLVAISGPSRTADIEMTLTRGVHGPGEVHVVLVGGHS